MLWLITALVSSVHAYDQPRPADYHALHPDAARSILYEVQARSANACRTDTGSPAQRAACAARVAPKPSYRAGDPSRCGSWNDLKQIRMGTLDDLLEDTADYRIGITLRYIKEKVGANAVWLMPLFPNNDRYDLPDSCDNLGSPYAVRDYLHAQASLDRACIRADKDEETPPTCWGNFALEKVIGKAHQLGMKVMLDVAFNHFGHNYAYYDYASFKPIAERVAKGEDLDRLWDFPGTLEQDLVHPRLADTEAAVPPALLADMKARCPQFRGDELVRASLMWREMLDGERKQFRCDNPVFLEYAAPGFYLGNKRNGDPTPSTRVGDNFTNNWVDVKFLYHHEYHGAAYATFVRNREYQFRILNYWVSRGIDGFRFDHTTDPDGGMGPNEWKYLLSKVDFYDWVRKGRPANHVPPMYLAEEFGDQMGMSHVMDIMTDGYVGDIRGGNGATKDASHVERAIDNEARFGGHTLVMRALETHDEHRLYESTGFDQWTGAGFWGVGAASHGTPMILMGQEFGESWGLGFRRSDFLRSRFVGHSNYRADGDALVSFYHQLAAARLDGANRALLSPNRWYLRSKHTGAADSRIFAQAKWDGSGNVVFTFNNLWNTPEEWVEQAYFLPPELAGQLSIQDGLRYQLADAFTGQRQGACRSGSELKWELYVKMHRSQRVQWSRLELCH